MTYTLKDYYKRIRANGATASRAIELARQNMAAKRPLYDIPAKQAICYNPQTAYGGRWVENVSAGLRFVGYADELAKRIDHKGWFIDGMQSEVYRGVVYTQPARNGDNIYAYGYADPYNDDCAYLMFTGFRDNDRCAAYAADNVAKHFAELELEHNNAWRDGQSYAQCKHEISQTRKALLALLRAMKASRRESVATPICDALRAQVNLYLEKMRALRHEKNKLFEEHAAAWNSEQWPSFNDGAGEVVLK